MDVNEARRELARRELARRKASGGFSQLQTGVEQVGEGLTGGFYDRVPAYLATKFIQAVEPGEQEFNPIYEKALAAGRRQMTTRREANPITATAGYVTGAIASPANKAGLLPVAGLHAAGNIEGVSPTQEPGRYAENLATGTAENLILPVLMRSAGPAVGRAFEGTKVGKAVEKVANKAGGYVSGSKVRLAEMLRKGIPEEELAAASQFADKASKFGGANLPLAAVPGQNISGFAKVAASNPAAGKEIMDASEQMTRILGRTSRKTGLEKQKGTFGEEVSKTYDKAKSDSLVPSKEMIAEKVMVKGKGGKTYQQRDFATGKPVVSTKEVEIAPALLRQNPEAAKLIDDLADLPTARETGKYSYAVIKNARDNLKASRNNYAPSDYAKIESQFNNITRGAFKEADEANTILNQSREAAGAVRKQAATTAQTARKEAFNEAQSPTAIRRGSELIASLTRGGAAALGIGAKKLEDIVANNPNAQRVLAELLLSRPAPAAIEFIRNTKPGQLNKLLEAFGKGGAVGITEEIK